MRDHTRRLRWFGASLAAIVLAGSTQPALAQDDPTQSAHATDETDEGLNVIYDGPGVRNPLIAAFGLWVVFLIMSEVLLKP